MPAQSSCLFPYSQESIFDSPPVLQNPSPHGVTVAWAVKTTATGWIEYGPAPELGRRADAPVCGQHIVGERFLHIRIEGLSPGEKVYYRVGAAPVEFKERFFVERGEPEYSPIYSFTTFDSSAEETSFSAINDTHRKDEMLSRLMPTLMEQPSDFTVWNGDLFHVVGDTEQITDAVLRPVNTVYAAERPVLFTTGNHDLRGAYARTLKEAIIPWESERPMERCFAVRQGPLAVIGLDTAEMRIDEHPGFGGLTCSEPYRKEQRDWLESALQRPEIASAPYLIVFCHIPLWGRPEEEESHMQDGRMQYCEQGQKLWHPLLEEAGAQLLISGHKHYFRYAGPCADHSYGQLVTGGPSLEQATLIHGQADKKCLKVTVRNLDGQELGTWQFAPRPGKE